jgi:peptidoglycan-associated lipoprotein
MMRKMVLKALRRLRAGSVAWQANTGWVVAGVLLLPAACQRPTQPLPPAPVFPVLEQQARAGVPEPESSARGTEPYAGPTTIYFAENSAELSAEAREILDLQAQWMIAHPGANASLQGHADEQGTRAFRFVLGEQRAAAMKFYLSARGVAGDRLSVTSFGKQRLAASEQGAAAARLNRRGVTVLTGDND